MRRETLGGLGGSLRYIVLMARMHPQMKVFALLFVLSVAASMSLAGIRAFGKSELQKQYSEKSGFYCQDKDTNAKTRENGVGLKLFAHDLNPDKTLRFAFTVFYSSLSDASFGIFAAHATPIGPDKWRYETGMTSANPEDRCAVNASMIDTGTWLIEKDPSTSCYLYQGARVRFGSILIDKETRIDSVTAKDVANQLWNMDTWNHVLDCTHKGAIPKPIAGRTP